MSKFSDMQGAEDSNGNIDWKPSKPQGDSCGNKSDYFTQKAWRCEKNEWKARQESRELVEEPTTLARTSPGQADPGTPGAHRESGMGRREVRYMQ